MTRKDAIQFLCRIPIGTPLVLDTATDGSDDLSGVVGYFAGLGLRQGADTVKLTGGQQVHAPRDADQVSLILAAAAVPVDQVELDEVRRVSVQLVDVRRGALTWV